MRFVKAASKNILLIIITIISLFSCSGQQIPGKERSISSKSVTDCSDQMRLIFQQGYNDIGLIPFVKDNIPRSKDGKNFDYFYTKGAVHNEFDYTELKNFYERWVKIRGSIPDIDKWEYEHILGVNREERLGFLFDPNDDRFLKAHYVIEEFLVTKLEAQSIKKYIDNNYNLSLYFQGEELAPEISTSVKQQIKYLDDVIAKSPGTPSDFVFYRGVPARESLPRVGEILQMEGFTSTSLNRQVAENFSFGMPGNEYEGIAEEPFEKIQGKLATDLHINAREDKLPKVGVLYRIYSAKGQKGLYFPYFEYYDSGVVDSENIGTVRTELEFVFPRSSKFEVTGIASPEPIRFRARSSDGNSIVEIERDLYVIDLKPVPQ